MKEKIMKRTQKTIRYACLTLAICGLNGIEGCNAAFADEVTVSDFAGRDPWGPKVRWADDTPEWIAGLRKSVAGVTCPTNMEREWWRLELADLRDSLKDHPHPGNAYAQHARFVALLPILCEEDPAKVGPDESQARRQYIEGCADLAKRAGVEVDLKRLEEERAGLIQKMDWPAVAKRKQQMEDDASFGNSYRPPESALAKQMLDAMSKALKGHPHPEREWTRQLETFQECVFPRWSDTPLNGYVAGCIDQLAATERPEALKYIENHFGFPHALESWMLVQWPRWNMAEKKRVVMDGLYALNGWNRYTRDPQTNGRILVPYTYFKHADRCADGTQGAAPNAEVIHAYAAKLGPAIRKELYEMWTDESEDGQIHEPDYARWVALLRQPGLSPTPKEMDQLLAHVDAGGDMFWSQGKNILALYLAAGDDDKRFMKLIDQRCSLWGNSVYEDHVRVVFNRTDPKQRQVLRNFLSEKCVGKTYFYKSGNHSLWDGPLDARAKNTFGDFKDYFTPASIAFLRSFNDSDLIKQTLADLRRLRTDAEKAAATPAIWDAHPDGSFDEREADPQGPARLRRFIKEKLDPVIELLESGKPLPPKTP